MTTDASGNAAIAVTLPRQAAGKFLTATATDSNGNTSEFSVAIPIASSLPAQTFTVSNTNDSGPGSLRQAINDANLAVTATNDFIVFNIPGAGPHIVRPLLALPALTDPVVLDGFTQPGAAANTSAVSNNAVWKIQIVGTNAGSTVDGLRLESSNSVVRGLVIAGFNGDGIEIVTNHFNRIEGCLIGLDISGAVLANNLQGVNVNQSAGSVIGGESPAARNIISGNNQVGVLLTGAGSSNNLVAGNLIGTGVSGTGDFGNGNDGIQVNGASANLIGGTVAAAANVIAGNNSDGLELTGVAATLNTVAGNRIGLDALDGPLGNNSAGVRINSNARANSIGLGVVGGGNVISFNGGSGIEITAGNEIVIRANSIYANGGLGIDFSGGGIPQPNDPLDPDTGPNFGQNIPVLTNGLVDPANTSIQGTLNSRVTTLFTLDFYSSEDKDASGFGEGRVWLGSTTATTDGSGNAGFSINLPMSAPGRYLTATATDPSGNTSEFSQALAVLSKVTGQTFTVVNTNDLGPGSLRQALLDASLLIASANHTIAFNLPGAGMQTIRPASVLPVPLVPVTMDGFTQPGSGSNTSATAVNATWQVELNGSLLGVNSYGLSLNQPGSVIRGLKVTRFYDGVILGAASNLVVEGCLVLSNTSHGIILSNAVAARVGGTVPAARNLISGNPSVGIFFEGGVGRDNVVLGNLIGTDAAGTGAGGGQTYGVYFSTASNNRLGGTNTGEANLIAFNGSAGVYIHPGTNNVIRGNRIFRNLLAIDLFPSLQVNANDPGDTDNLGNLGQNFPVLASATAAVGSTTIQGSLNSNSNGVFTVDFYSGAEKNLFGHGEGEFYLGSIQVTTDGAGNAAINVVIPANIQGNFIGTGPRGTNVVGNSGPKK